MSEAGKPIANAVIRVHNDTSGRDIDHDITSGESAEYSMYQSLITAMCVQVFCWDWWSIFLTFLFIVCC